MWAYLVNIVVTAEAGASVPILSAPGVQSVTATTAVVKVTLTYS
jgi:hypothetical protein